jgi:hypothetical protein
MIEAIEITEQPNDKILYNIGWQLLSMMKIGELIVE